MSADIAVVGLGVMGGNIARNIDRNGFVVSLYNRTRSKTDEVIRVANSQKMIGCDTLEECVNSLKTPRVVLMMVTDSAVDVFTEQLGKLLKPGDILIDGGNSHWKATERRQQSLNGTGVNFIGMGISGGEEGALKGPSIMFGGPVEAWNACKHILTTIGAKAEDGQSCVARVGERGSGHFVKMVHNAIEYADLQLIAEIYDLMKNVLHLSNEEMAETFSNWNKAELRSFLIQSAEIVLKKKEEKGHIIDFIKGVAGQKGTGKWAAQDAFDIGFPTPAFSEAVDARLVSGLILERQRAALIYPKPSQSNPLKITVQHLKDALYASKIVAYAQGLALIDAANKQFNYGVNLAECARIWRAGCIIRADLLAAILQHFTPEYPNLLLVPHFANEVRTRLESWRLVVASSTLSGIPVPVLSSSLSFLDSYTTDKLPANMIQAIRDYFGAHTYQRIDKEGVFHTEWDTQ